MNDASEAGHLSELGAQFAQVSALVTSANGRIAPYQVVDFARRVLPHDPHCAITLARANRPPEPVAFSGEYAQQIDKLQRELKEGPGFEALESNELVICDDVLEDRRWSKFGERCATEIGIRSVLSLSVPHAKEDRATLSFYSTKRSAFDRQDADTASIMTPFVTIAVTQMVHERDVSTLEVALETSRQIGTAIGILMARHRVTSEDAFGLLRAASKHLNRKLRTIADEVVLTGELPSPIAGRRGSPQTEAFTRLSKAS